MTSTAEMKCHSCGSRRPAHMLSHAINGSNARTTKYAYCRDHKACRDAAIDWSTAWQPCLRWFVKYGVWVLIGLVFLAWEMLGVKSFRRVTGMGERDHPSLSEVVWELERRFGLPGRVVTGAFMVDLTVHFLVGTPLIPGVG